MKGERDFTLKSPLTPTLSPRGEGEEAAALSPRGEGVSCSPLPGVKASSTVLSPLGERDRVRGSFS